MSRLRVIGFLTLLWRSHLAQRQAERFARLHDRAMAEAKACLAQAEREVEALAYARAAKRR